MSHHRNTSGGEVITIECDNLPEEFIVGNIYQLLNFGMDGFGNGLIIQTHAVSPVELAINVEMVWNIPEVGSFAFTGIFDWENCILTELADDKGNRVSGSENISNFPWVFYDATNNIVESGGKIIKQANSSSVNLFNNLVTSGGTLDLTSYTGDGDISNNVISNGGTVTLTGSRNINFIRNKVEYSSVSVSSFALIGNNTFTGASTIFISRAASDKLLEFSNNIVSSFSNVSIRGNKQTTITDNNISASELVVGEITEVITGTLIIEKNDILLGSSVSVVVGTQNGDITIVFNLLQNESILTLVGNVLITGSLFITDNIIGNKGLLGINGVTAIPTSSIFGNTIQNSEVTLSGIVEPIAANNVHAIGGSNLVIGNYSAQNIYLALASSTLVANVNGQSKVGYSGALP